MSPLCRARVDTGRPENEFLSGCRGFVGGSSLATLHEIQGLLRRANLMMVPGETGLVKGFGKATVPHSFRVVCEMSGVGDVSVRGHGWSGSHSPLISQTPRNEWGTVGVHGDTRVSQSGTLKSGIVTDNLDQAHHPAILTPCPAASSATTAPETSTSSPAVVFSGGRFWPGLIGAICFWRFLRTRRQDYRFIVIGYVVMPEHFHLLMSEPEKGDPSVVMKVVKQHFSHQVLKTYARTSDSGPTLDECA